MTAPRLPWLPLAAVGTTLLFWSSAFVAIRHLGHDFSPGALSLGRLLVGSVALGSVLLVRGARRPSGRDWPALIAIGVLWFGVYNVALNAAERRIDAGTASMLIQVSPLLIAVLAAVFLKERATGALVVGMLLAFGGVTVIGLSGSPGGNGDLVGVLLCVLASASYAVSMISQKPLLRRLPALQVTWTACTVGAIACLPFAGDLVDQVRAAPASSILWLVFLGLFPTAIAFTTFAYALTHMDAGKLGVTTYLVPPLTVLMGWLFLAETPPTLAYVGGLLCLVGVAVARRRTRAMPTPADAGAATDKEAAS
jgi:drug/metabolite transporter (DMT)-like permease